jgi:hypothetical protein
VTPGVDLAAVPDPDADGGHEELFGAATVAGLFEPTPTVTLAGSAIAAGPGGDPTGKLMVVDGLTVTWGREEVLSQPEPATATVALFDGSKRWATSRDLIGQPVTLAWTGEVPGVGTVGDVIFRGRIAGVTVAPRTAAGVPGSLVSLTLTSILNDLANRIPRESWPAETLGERLARINAATGGVVSAVDVRQYWRDPRTPPVDAADQVSLYEHIVALFNSSGADRFTYNPREGAQEIGYLTRRDFPNLRGLAGLWWNLSTDGTSARAGLGVYVRTYGVTAVGSGGTGEPTYLDAAALEYDPADGLTRSVDSRISRVELTHPDSEGTPVWAERTTTALVPGADEATEGRRTLTVESLVGWSSWADVAASDLAALAAREGAAWRLAPLLYDTRRTGGFENWRQARELLAGHERQTLFFLQRSWLPVYGLRPVFGVMGGTYTYAGGGWQLELHLAPVTTYPTAQHAITWEEIDTGDPGLTVEWHDGPHRRALHETVTYEDLGYVSAGLGATVFPPDTGWDTPQT